MVVDKKATRFTHYAHFQFSQKLKYFKYTLWSEKHAICRWCKPAI